MANNCSIIYNDGKIDRVLAPNGVDSLLFKSILDYESDREKALRLWGQAYTLKFKKWFGEWELLAKAKALSNNVKGMYSFVFKDNIELFLFETAIQAKSSELELQGAISAFGEDIVNIALEMFPDAKVGDVFIPTVSMSVDENGEPLVTNTDNGPVFINTLNDNQKKSIFNNGSFLYENNDTTLDIRTKDSELFNAEIFDNTVSVGGLTAINDGAYLTIEGIAVEKTGENIGTNAYLKMAQFAIDNGLQLRSDVIPTRMSQAAIATWDRLVKTGQAEIQGDRYIFTGSTKTVTDDIFYNIAPNKVNYQLKLINALGKIQRKTYPSNNVQGFYNDLIKQGVPKAQLDILKNHILSNNIQEINTEDLITSLLAEMSYTVEINTATSNEPIAQRYADSGVNLYEKDGKYYSYDPSEDSTTETTKEYYDNWIEDLKPIKEPIPTQHYKGMTVPGGTNYTENEIATPAIVPSIKGHAQFATENGIGWFRSDDKENKIVGWKEEDDFLNSETAQYNPITKDDKVIFGHPTIGKSYLKKQGNNDFITLDDDYADEVNAFIDANRGKETRQEYKGRKPKEYNQFMLNLFDRLKLQAKKEGKRLFVSNTNILKERMSDFDKVITIPKDEFKKRFDARGATYGFEDWKSDIDATVAKVDKSKVINTTGYLSDLLEGNPKTRRILEVQSDLFQKGRDKSDLITYFTGDFESHFVSDFKLDGVYYQEYEGDYSKNDGSGLVDITKEEYDKARKKYNPDVNKKSPENQFLQLLNKDNNWVTFFVKSIIQDSAKKEYEKVLFPKGDTATKIEGHTTLEEFKKQKEDRIKEIEQEKIKQKSLIGKEIPMPGQPDFLDETVTLTEELYDEYLQNADRELTQLKAELERVETEGFGALKPIYNFYENTVKNILKKNYKINEVTDEYGNQWYNIDITSEIVQKVDTILMNLKLQQKYESIPEAALFNLSKNGFVTKFNPHDIVNEDRWYFNQSNGLDVSEKLYHQYMSLNNLNRDMFKEGVTQAGIPYLVPNRNFNLVDSIEENNEKIHKDKYEALIDFFVNKLSIPKDKINYVTKKEFAEKFPEQYNSNAQSAYIKGQFYFFTNNLTSDITVEELLHPFIFTVKQLNPGLFNNLLKEAQKSYPLLHQKIQVLYKSQPQSIRDQELVTQAMSRVFNNVYESEEPKSFFDVIKEWVKWLSSTLNSLLDYFGTGKYIHVDVTDLHPLTSMEQIAQLLNATDTKFDVIFPEGSFFNLSSNPEDFNKVVATLLTDKRVEARVEEILVKLPKTLKDIKKRLTSSINETEKQELQNVIKQIEELTGEDKESLLKSQLKGIITTAQLFNTLEEELNTIDRSDMDDSLKLSYFMSIHKTAESLSGFKELMVELNNELKANLRKKSNPNVERFNYLLTTAISAKDNIEYSVRKLIKAPLLEKLVESNEHTYSIPLSNIDKEIRELERQITSTSSQPEKEKLQNKISILLKNKKAILEKAPTKENLEKVFDGVFKDANQLSHIFESKIANGHPLINTLQHIVNGIYDRAGSNMLNSKNEAQTQSDEFSQATGRNLRDMEKRFEGIGDDLVKIPTGLKFKKDSETELELDENNLPQFEYIQQNALVQEIDNSYITKYMELEILKDYYFKLHFENLKNNIKDGEDSVKYKEAFEAFDKFKKENSQRQYTNDYYVFRAMLDEKIGDKTIRQITQDSYDEIDRLQDALERADSSTRNNIVEAIKIAKVELKKLKSEFNDDGTKKNEEGLKVASILKEYAKLRYEYGDDVLTDEGLTKYQFDLDALEFKKDQYHPDVYKKLLNNLQQTVISPDYFEALSAITDNINSLTNILSEAAQSGDIAQYIDKKDKNEKKDIYKEIRELVKPYRDDDQIIDGIVLSNQNPPLVGKIKELQQYVENLKFESIKLTSLSPSETNEFRKLKRSDSRTTQEQQRFQELSDKKDALKKFKAENLSIINELNSLFKELSSLSTTQNTDYYDRMIDIMTSKLKNDEEVVEISLDFVEKNDIIVLNDQRYKREDGKWYLEQKLGKKTTMVFLGDKNVASDTGYKEIVNAVVNYLAQEKLKQTDWWKDNHYIQYIYNSKTGTFAPTERAIYIWEHQIPNNPNFIEIKPAKEYHKYTVKDLYINKEYDTIYRNIPTAIKNKFVNKRYAESMAVPAKAKFLSYLRNKYLEIQKIYPDNIKMGHILPAVVKTSGENAVNTTNKILSFDGTFKEMFHTNAGKTDTDTSYLVGGSQTNSQTIPTRFVGKMDTSAQTKDALAAILLFEYHTSLYKALNENLPIFEASQLLVAEVDVLERKNYIEKLGFVDKVRKMFHPSKDAEEQTQKKEIEKSVLSKSVDNILDVFVYGQRIKPMVVDMGPIGKVDLAKVSSNVLGFAAKSIFIGNIISSINNSLSTRLQAIVNADVKSGLYSFKNLANAQGIAPKYTKDLLSDWTKLGNKSLIGQVLDYFAFLAENPSGEITNKSEFTLLKNKMEFLTSAKQMSEFEVLFVQFLTIADATTIKVNGKETKLSKIEDIFEIKDGKFKMKDGVEFTKKQESMFRGKFQSMARKLQGAYRQTEISSIETNWAGKSALFLRRFFVAMATNRFAGERWNSQEQEVQMGYQREAFNSLVNLFKDYQNFGLKQWNKMSDREKSSFFKTVKEYGILILLISLLSLAGGDDDKKKLKENSWFHNMTLVALLRAKSEMEQFTLKGTDDLIRMGKNPFMIFTTMGNVWKIVGLSGPTIMGSDNAFYKQNTGLHKKGDSKLVATFLKLIGYTGATFHPEEYYVNFKNAQNR